jgi:hypothetical protein
MKKSQLRNIIKEEISKVLNEGMYVGSDGTLRDDEMDNILNKPGVVRFPGDEEDYIEQLHNLEDYITKKGKKWRDYEPILKRLGVNTYDFSSWLDSAHPEEMQKVIKALYKYAKTLY